MTLCTIFVGGHLSLVSVCWISTRMLLVVWKFPKLAEQDQWMNAWGALCRLLFVTLLQFGSHWVCWFCVDSFGLNMGSCALSQNRNPPRYLVLGKREVHHCFLVSCFLFLADDVDKFGSQQHFTLERYRLGYWKNKSQTFRVWIFIPVKSDGCHCLNILPSSSLH